MALEIRDLPAAENPWENLPRYAAHDRPGVLHVRRSDQGRYCCAAYSLLAENARYPHLTDGLFVSLDYHYGRMCWIVDRQYTRPDSSRQQCNEIEWFKEFEDAIASVATRQMPKGARK